MCLWKNLRLFPKGFTFWLTYIEETSSNIFEKAFRHKFVTVFVDMCLLSGPINSRVQTLSKSLLGLLIIEVNW